MSKLNILNQQANIIGEEEREVIHRDGLWHKEVNVWFYTPDRKVILQHRSKNKDTFPDTLDATAGGHVEIGDDYEKTVIKEVKEETGIDIDKNNLDFVDIIQVHMVDEGSHTINNSFKARYIYRYDGEIDEMIPEKGKVDKFEYWNLDDLLNMDEDDEIKFIPGLFSEEEKNIFEVINNKLK